MALCTSRSNGAADRRPLRNIVSHPRGRRTGNFAFSKAQSRSTELSLSLSLSRFAAGEWPVTAIKLSLGSSWLRETPKREPERERERERESGACEREEREREREVEGKGDGEPLARHQRAIIGRQVVRGSIFRTMPAKPYGRPTGHLLAGHLRAQRADLLTSREPRIIAPFRSLRVRPALITATPPSLSRPLPLSRPLRSIGKNLSFPPLPFLLVPSFPPWPLNHLSLFLLPPWNTSSLLNTLDFSRGCFYVSSWRRWFFFFFLQSNLSRLTRNGKKNGQTFNILRKDTRASMEIKELW